MSYIKETVQQFLEGLTSVEVDQELVSEVEAVYKHSLNTLLQEIVTSCKTLHIMGECKTLYVEEILNPGEELSIAFPARHLLPLFYIMDLTYIVYDFDKDGWCKFSGSDSMAYGYGSTLEELLTQSE